MGPTPDELRTDVEYRRAHLARNVDLLTDRVTPRKVARRKAGAARGRLSGVKERVMGTARETTGRMAETTKGVADSAGQTSASVAETAKETTDRLGDAVSQAPAQVRQQTQGSPLAAGLIAFGAGMLTAALLPTTEAEERVGQQLREHSGELLEPAKQQAVQAAQEIKEELREPAAEAVDAVKSTAQDAARTTMEETRTAGQETAEGLRQVGKDAAGEVQGQSSGRPGPPAA
jgi:gas vesicle protein